MFVLIKGFMSYIKLCLHLRIVSKTTDYVIQLSNMLKIKTFLDSIAMFLVITSNLRAITLRLHKESTNSK